MAEFVVKVESVDVYTALGKQIQLNKLVAKVKTAEYEPEQFPGLVYKLSDPKAAALIFSNGKIICTGTKSIGDANDAISKVVSKLKSVGVQVPSRYEVRIEKIVAATKIDKKLNLKEVAFSLENAEYNPEEFPGVIYRLKEPAVTVLLFKSGKIVCTDAHSMDDIDAGLNRLIDNLESIGIDVKPAAE